MLCERCWLSTIYTTDFQSFVKSFYFFRKSTDKQGGLRQLLIDQNLSKYFLFSLFMDLLLFIFFEGEIMFLLQSLGEQLNNEVAVVAHLKEIPKICWNSHIPYIQLSNSNQIYPSSPHLNTIMLMSSYSSFRLARTSFRSFLASRIMSLLRLVDVWAGGLVFDCDGSWRFERGSGAPYPLCGFEVGSILVVQIVHKEEDLRNPSASKTIPSNSPWDQWQDQHKLSSPSSES